MRKMCILLLLSAILLLSTTPVNAATGEIVGKVYSTDILAKINGYAIRSYNMGGKTLVFAEDLYDWNGIDYGFDGSYDEEKRILAIHSRWHKAYGSEVPEQRGRLGAILGDVRRTDVKIHFNDVEVIGYVVDGKIALCLEELGKLDGTLNEKYGYSKYLARFHWDEEKRIIELNSFFSNEYEIMGHAVHSYEYTAINNVIYAEHDPMHDYYSGSLINLYTDGFETDYHILKPLYLTINGERFEIGYYAVSNNSGSERALFYLTDVENTKSILDQRRTPQKTYQESMSYLTSSEQFRIEKQVDNEHYTVLAVTEVKTGSKYIVAAKKAGGYLRIHAYSGDDLNVSFSLEENIVMVKEYPYPGLSGPRIMITTIDLDELEF